jgi:GH24 family phage-related lysozyme (muramidase)
MTQYSVTAYLTDGIWAMLCTGAVCVDAVPTMQGMQNQHEAPLVSLCVIVIAKDALNSYLPERLSSCQQHVAWLGLH